MEHHTFYIIGKPVKQTIFQSHGNVPKSIRRCGILNLTGVVWVEIEDSSMLDL